MRRVLVSLKMPKAKYWKEKADGGFRDLLPASILKQLKWRMCRLIARRFV
jgi:hypothetical protein